uniref:Cyclic nucleotide-binding domain-containing protein n=1 Tax=Palpitomonas bilix TaxID=652834 RepID=A0A7S3GKY1_9EUKA|mmetsp:Transcript_7729/g.20075  ORF Transcript_7729/g.20075 Transcript_7729/m.20075 type:complete len:806 (+) Transcript_7729:325-2742(+)
MWKELKRGSSLKAASPSADTSTSTSTSTSRPSAGASKFGGKLGSLIKADAWKKVKKAAKVMSKFQENVDRVAWNQRVEECKVILLKETRTPEEVVVVRSLLKSVRAFKQLSNNLLDKLGEILDVVELQEGTTVFAQGDVGDQFYLILSGSVSVEVEKDGHAFTVAKLFGGDTFGELALINDAPRKASVIVRDHCMLVSVHRDDYIKFIRNGHAKEMDERRRFLFSLSALSPMSKEEVEGLSMVMTTTTLAKGMTLYKEGDDADKVYIVVKGKLRIVRSLTLPTSSSIEVEKGIVPDGIGILDIPAMERDAISTLTRSRLVELELERQNEKLVELHAAATAAYAAVESAHAELEDQAPGSSSAARTASGAHTPGRGKGREKGGGRRGERGGRGRGEKERKRGEYEYGDENGEEGGSEEGEEPALLDIYAMGKTGIGLRRGGGEEEEGGYASRRVSMMGGESRPHTSGTGGGMLEWGWNSHRDTSRQGRDAPSTFIQPSFSARALPSTAPAYLTQGGVKGLYSGGGSGWRAMRGTDLPFSPSSPAFAVPFSTGIVPRPSTSDGGGGRGGGGSTLNGSPPTLRRSHTATEISTREVWEKGYAEERAKTAGNMSGRGRGSNSVKARRSGGGGGGESVQMSEDEAGNSEKGQSEEQSTSLLRRRQRGGGGGGGRGEIAMPLSLASMSSASKLQTAPCRKVKKSVEVDSVGQGRIIGDREVVEKTPRIETAIADSTVDLLVISKWDFLSRFSSASLSSIRNDREIASIKDAKEARRLLTEGRRWKKYKQNLVAQIQAESRAGASSKFFSLR